MAGGAGTAGAAGGVGGQQESRMWWQQQLQEWAEMEQKDCCDFGAFENSHVCRPGSGDSHAILKWLARQQNEQRTRWGWG